MPSDNLIHRLPRHLKMSELRVFVAVLTHRNFHKAAAVVNLSQPAVTKSIAGLEQTLNVKLFERHANGVEPTSYGLSFAPRALAIFDELRRAAQELATLASGATGELRLGTVPMTATPFLPIAVQALVKIYPECFVSVVEAREAELFDRLRKGDIELAFLRLSLVDLDADMRATALFDEQLAVFAGRDHPLVKRERLAWDELLQQRWVMPPPDCIFYEYVRRNLAGLGLTMPRTAVEAYSVPVQVGLTQHGGMLSFGMLASFEFGDQQHQLIRLPIDLAGVARPVAVVSARARARGVLAQQLIEHVCAQYADVSSP
ncbi:LysR family transcriptional regulator [Roseateles sp.]|uniref:LysR family transcriptional regulator n=1 Tax=Roseateles sp. TaxID=1971397 RepID=UPI00286B68D9|nr:LysR family transcriptional regulator [Roseateles sp.]